MKKLNNKENIPIIILFIVLLLCLPQLIILLVFVILPILFFRKISKKETVYKNKTSIDFSKEKDYYRDLIKIYSIAELAFVDNLEINEKIVAICTLLKLKLNKVIDIDNNSIKILKQNFDDLKKSEKYLLEKCENGKIEIFPMGSFEEVVKQEAMNDGLVEIPSNIKKPIFLKKIELIILFILFNLIMISLAFIFHSNENQFFIMYCLSFIVFVIFECFYYNLYKHILNTTPKRSGKGEEINIKVEGLKIFLQDFGDLEDENIQALMAREEYLIYSCLFKINKEIVDNMSELVKITKIKVYKNW